MGEGKEENQELNENQNVVEENTEVETKTQEQIELEEVTDRYKRLLAEFENFKKRR